MITIDAPEIGPTPAQRSFFEALRPHLREYEERARDYMRSRLNNGGDLSRLATYSIEIGSADDTARREFVLELCDGEAKTIHRVAFRGEEPVDHGFDE